MPKPCSNQDAIDNQVAMFYFFAAAVFPRSSNNDVQFQTRRRFIILLYAWFPTLIGLFCIYVYKLAELALCVVFILVLLTAVVITRFERWYLG